MAASLGALGLITTLIQDAPAFVNLILSIFHPDGTRTIMASITMAEANNAEAATALSTLQTAINAKNAENKTVTVKPA